MAQSTRLFSTICRNNLSALKDIKSLNQVRFYSYLSSKQYNENEKIDFEVSKDPEDWKYVSRLIPTKLIPDPEPKKEYPSGWNPQRPESIQSPYFVQRSRNHMLPVYLMTTQRGMRKLTYVRHIFGDIWLFSSELKAYLEKKDDVLEVGMKVDEFSSKLVLRGDYVYYTKEFILQKGM